MKYYNGCSLVDFFSFSLQTEVQKLMAKVRFGAMWISKLKIRTNELVKEHRLKNRKTSSGSVDLRTLQTREVFLLKVLSVNLKQRFTTIDRAINFTFNIFIILIYC